MDLEIPNLFSESNGALSKLGVEREKEREREMEGEGERQQVRCQDCQTMTTSWRDGGERISGNQYRIMTRHGPLCLFPAKAAARIPN